MLGCFRRKPRITSAERDSTRGCRDNKIVTRETELTIVLESYRVHQFHCRGALRKHSDKCGVGSLDVVEWSARVTKRRRWEQGRLRGAAFIAVTTVRSLVRMSGDRQSAACHTSRGTVTKPSTVLNGAS